MQKIKRKLKLIIADDHTIFRIGLETVLTSTKMFSKITHACNGEEVLQFLHEEHYDLVLMDIRMEPMDGIKATELITKRYPDTKVLALTMFDDGENIKNMIAKGAKGYLVKNASQEELIDAIQRVVDDERYLSREASKILMDEISIVTGKATEAIKEDLLKERFMEIVFLISHELTTKNIGKALNVSPRTIETNKSEIKKLIAHQKITGIAEYAIEHGIKDDAILLKKFKNTLTEKREVDDQKN